VPFKAGEGKAAGSDSFHGSGHLRVDLVLLRSLANYTAYQNSALKKGMPGYEHSPQAELAPGSKRRVRRCRSRAGGSASYAGPMRS
jgi:hypothetical protein